MKTAGGVQNSPPTERVWRWPLRLITAPLSVTALSTQPLTVPIQQPLTVAPIPQLTGVVKGPGGSSSAIFQLGQGSVSAGIGEAIGSSGWVLSEVTDSGAVISHNGQRQTLSVGGLF